MCGILLIVNHKSLPACREPDVSPGAADFVEGLACRGPDAQGDLEVSCGPALLHFQGSLLQLRGAAPSASPLVDAGGNVLVFNGQIFPPCSLDVPPGTSDAQLLLAALGAPGAHVPAVLTGLRGPWSLVYWHAATCTLWFGRDPIGRRSLLVHAPSPADGRFMLSSSAPLDPAVPFQGFEELPPGIYSLALEPDLAGPGTAGAAGAAAVGAGAVAADAAAVATCAAAGQADPAGGAASAAAGCSAAAAAVCSPRGDAAVWGTYWRHEWTEPAVRELAAFWRAPELVEPLPLADPAAADRDAQATGSPAQQGPAKTAAGAGTAQDAEFQEDIAFEQTVDAVLAALRQAVATRCRCIEEGWREAAAALQQRGLNGGAAAAFSADKQPREGAQSGSGSSMRQPPDATPAVAGAALPAPSCASDRQPPSAGPVPLLPQAPLLILFSGGVDSTLLAALAHEALPPEAPIDLASVCFDGGASPDRLSALDALAELRQLAPSRRWRLVQVDCSLADVEAARPRLLRLLAPADTVMDLNIGAALWLAARGAGALLPAQIESAAAGQGAQPCGAAPVAAAAAPAPVQQDQQRPDWQLGGLHLAAACCRSKARVVLLGHGADELFGGYGRHRTAFRARGWQGLGDELALDLRRLWLRNLGRDDRLVADHGREGRHPFLDEGVVSAALAAPLHHLTDLRLPPGQGDKRVLRACLRRLGLPRAAARAKRAIQFGSRLAAKTNSAAFGGTRRANLLNAGSVRLADVPAAPAVPAVASTGGATPGPAAGGTAAGAAAAGQSGV